MKRNVDGHEAHGSGHSCQIDCVHCHLVIAFNAGRGKILWVCVLCGWERLVG